MNEKIIPPKGFIKMSNSCGLTELDKLKSELEKEQEDKKKILLNIIEVIDSLDSIIEEEKENVFEGDAEKFFNKINKTRLKLEKILSQNKVYPMDLAGGKAELGYCEIVKTAERKDREEDEIVQVLRKGYLWEGKVLRMASVITVK